MTTEQVSESTSTTSAPQDTGDVSNVTTPTQNESSQPSALDNLRAKAAAVANIAAVSPNQDLADKAAGIQTPNSYTPNYKFKAMDKMHEIEEWMRPYIKDAETEKLARKLHEKAYAIDDIKAQKDSYRQNYEQLQPQAQHMANQIATVERYKKTNDFDSMFNYLGITNDQILNHAQKILDVAKMSPEQRQQLDSQRYLQEQTFQQQNQNSELMQMYQAQAVQTRTLELNYALDRPDSKKISDAWDSKTGQPGSFRALVIKEAQNHAMLTGEDLSGDQAVQNVLNNYGKVLSLEAAIPQQNAQAIPQPGNLPGQPNAAPIIPHVAGKGGSPVKKKPRSIADLKALGKSMGA